MKTVKYSKEKLYSQSQSKSFISKKIAVNSVLTVQDLIPGQYKDRNGKVVINDKLLVVDEEGEQLKLPIKEFMKFDVKVGERYQSDDDNDDIVFPSQIIILDSKDRIDVEGRKRFPTYAYTGAQDFIDSNGELDYIKTVIESDLRDPNPFDVLQNYTVELKA